MPLWLTYIAPRGNVKDKTCMKVDVKISSAVLSLIHWIGLYKG